MTPLNPKDYSDALLEDALDAQQAMATMFGPDWKALTDPAVQEELPMAIHAALYGSNGLTALREGMELAVRTVQRCREQAEIDAAEDAREAAREAA